MKIKPYRAFVACSVVSFCALFASPVKAAITKINFNGTVGIVIGTSAQAFFTPGDTFSGSFTYDTTVADNSPISTLGQYGRGMRNYSIAFSNGDETYYAAAIASGFTFNPFGPNTLEVSDGVSFDSFRAAATGFASPAVGLDNLRFQINFQDNDGVNNGSTFSSDALPAAPDLDSLSVRTGTWQFGGGNIVSLTNISAVANPEPSRALLLLVGALAVTSRRRR